MTTELTGVGNVVTHDTRRARQDELADRSVDDHVATLERLSAVAPDGHATTTCPSQSLRAYPPFAVDVIEGQVVVTATTNKAVVRGDVIVAVDGRPAIEQLAADAALAAARPSGGSFARASSSALAQSARRWPCAYAVVAPTSMLPSRAATAYPNSSRARPSIASTMASTTSTSREPP